MTAIKERPILFSAPMVRAILEGRKMVTRRAIKVQPFDLSWSRRDHKIDYVSGRAENGDEVDGFWAYTTRSGGQWEAKCPYGQPGDRLWVRETTEADEDTAECAILSRYVADRAPVLYSGCDDPEYNGTWAHWDYPRQSKPSIHMPRWASRILLEITDVRVERLQDISPEQVTAEGVGTRGEAMWGSRWWVDAPDQAIEDARMDFADLWSSINGAESWKANPWVWVVEFKRVQP